MSVDLLIDPKTNDLAHKDGLMLYATSGNEVVQRVVTRVRRLRGEWFTNISVGIPYIPDILGQRNTNYFKLLLRKEILQTEGVDNIRVFRMSFNASTGEVVVYVEIKANGEYVPITMEL